jgi:thiosulfate dehydrogenase
MGKVILGILIGVLLVPIAGYLYFRSGYVPVATTDPPMPFETLLAKTALHATLKREAPMTHSTAASEALLVGGAGVYVKNCAVCHGLPGEPATAISKGMFPPPPHLFEKDDMVTDDPVGVTYWKAKHGIRLTGMPGFGGALTDEQLWEVSLLLANADKLTPAVKQALTAPAAPAAQPPNSK